MRTGDDTKITFTTTIVSWTIDRTITMQYSRWILTVQNHYHYHLGKITNGPKMNNYR